MPSISFAYASASPLIYAEGTADVIRDKIFSRYFSITRPSSHTETFDISHATRGASFISYVSPHTYFADDCLSRREFRYGESCYLLSPRYHASNAYARCFRLIFMSFVEEIFLTSASVRLTLVGPHYRDFLISRQWFPYRISCTSSLHLAPPRSLLTLLAISKACRSDKRCH